MRPNLFFPGRVLFVVLSAGWLALAPLSLRAKVRDLPPDVAQLYNAGLYRQATEALAAALETKPEEDSLYFWQGRCFFELRDFDRAIFTLERAIAIEPRDSDYHYWLGKSYGRKAEDTSRFNAFSGFSLAHKTHHEFETAVRLDEKNMAAQRDLIRYLSTAPGIAGGSEEEAERRIRALADVNPTEAALARAGVFAAHRKFNEAGREYQKILDSKPGSIRVYFEVAEYYRDRRDGAQMSAATDAGALLAPPDPRLDYYRGIVLVLQNGNPAEAEKHLTQYMSTVPDNDDVPSHTTAHEWLGQLYENQDQFDRASEEYHTALMLDPHNREARERLRMLQHRKR